MPETPWLRIEARSKKKKKYQPRPLDGDLLFVQEQEEVRVIVEVGERDVRPEATFDARPLTWNEREGAFLLAGKTIAHWVGSAELVVSAGARTRTLWVEVAPRERKATPDEWLRMLRQIESWMPGISLGNEGGRHGEVDEVGVSAPLLAEALAPLLPLFAQAVREIVCSPRAGERLLWHDSPLRATGSVDRESLRWLGRSPEAAQWFRADEPIGPEPRIPQRRAAAHVDHPANRYIARVVRRVLDELGRVRDELVRLAARYEKESLNDTGTWCLARAERLAGHLDDIERLWRGSFLRSLPPSSAPGAALAVLIDHPSYARVHQLGRLLLSPRFRLPETEARRRDAPGAPVRASFDLYELWTFLFVQRSLAERLPAPAWTWQARNLRCLLDATDTGTGACFLARGPREDLVEILFNESFVTCPHGELQRSKPVDPHAAPRCYSLSQRRRPDLLVRRRRPGQDGRWVCLDAKYCDPSSLNRPMQALHTYRDALWMEGYGGRCRAGLLLAPACPKSKAWATSAFRNRFEIGVWECPPGSAPDPELADWILSHLER